MSTENAVKFLEAAWNNEDLKDRVREQSSLEEIMVVAFPSGYDFTEEEFYKAQLEIADEYDFKMSEEVLTANIGVTVCVVPNSSHDCHHGNSAGQMSD